jgi:hypothetical protein
MYLFSLVARIFIAIRHFGAVKMKISWRCLDVGARRPTIALKVSKFSPLTQLTTELFF